eukprot:TRINITY_DN9336_c0_g1_i5.p1 TRINITY_DN9336_c0_g1~~TRINITY_DN9336_c0_g1_i5.p1  ORF type:complete len:326 (+),score=54.41 TRINITY_DN9336_c0_g1_i5:123-1100(+)
MFSASSSDRSSSHVSVGESPRYVFAVAGGSRASVYEIDPISEETTLLQAYVDEQKDECFYTCAWSCLQDKGVVLAVAGSNAIIRLVTLARFDNYSSLQGHGHAINELQFHPSKANLLASASKDHTIRLWNVHTQVCICVFAGENGHRDEVLSLDFHPSGTQIVSCGMDHNVKLWQLDDNVHKRIRESDTVTQEELDKHAFAPLTIHFPSASTSAVHRNYVDCVRWFGDCFVTKSTENQVACWQFGGDPRLDLDDKRRAYLGDPITILSKLNLSDCEVWYLRFCFHPVLPLLSVGNTSKTSVILPRICLASKNVCVLAHIFSWQSS